MKILSWNCRGFAQASTVRTLRALARIHHPDIIFLCETKIQLFAAHNPLARMGFPLLFQVPAVGLKGGLLVACKLGTDAEPIALNNHQISFLIYSAPASQPWLVTCAHAPSTWHDRSPFWKDIEEVGARFLGPKLLIGDFNAVLSPAEKFGGRDFGSSSS
jgi:endonuclease/exonuclease/phosphatase (EEP) superfamily protein YafD